MLKIKGAPVQPIEKFTIRTELDALLVQKRKPLTDLINREISAKQEVSSKMPTIVVGERYNMNDLGGLDFIMENWVNDRERPFIDIKNNIEKAIRERNLSLLECEFVLDDPDYCHFIAVEKDDSIWLVCGICGDPCCPLGIRVSE